MKPQNNYNLRLFLPPKVSALQFLARVIACQLRMERHCKDFLIITTKSLPNAQWSYLMSGHFSELWMERHKNVEILFYPGH